MESVILRKHSEVLSLGVFRKVVENQTLIDGVYQIISANDNGLDGFIVNKKKIDIIQVECEDKDRKWTDGLHGKIPKENKICDDDNLAIKEEI